MSKEVQRTGVPKLPKGNKKPVSDFLGVNGLYSGKNLKYKLGRAVLFAFVVGVSVPIIGRVGDSIFGSKSVKGKPEPVRKKIDPNIVGKN